MSLLARVVGVCGLPAQRIPYLITIGTLGPCTASSLASTLPLLTGFVLQPGIRNLATSSAAGPEMKWQATGEPAVMQLEEAFHLYRRIMRANRRALPKLSVRRLADTFVKNEFRLHMAAVSDLLHRSENFRLAGKRATPTEMTTSAYERENVGSSQGFLSRMDDDTPMCSEEQFRQFLAAWEDYLFHAVNTATPLHVGRTLKPSQRKLLSEEQKAQLRKLKEIATPPVSG